MYSTLSGFESGAARIAVDAAVDVSDRIWRLAAVDLAFRLQFASEMPSLPAVTDIFAAERK